MSVFFAALCVQMRKEKGSAMKNAVVKRQKKGVETKRQARKPAPTISKQRNEVMTVAKNGSVSPIAKMCWVTSIILALAGLVWCIYHSLNQHTIDDAELKEISLYTMNNLKALKRNTVHCLHGVYNMLIIFIVIVGSFGIAFMVFYKDTSKYRATMATLAPKPPERL